MWPGPPSGVAGTDGDLALGQAGDDLGFVGVAEVDPGEVGLGSGGREAEVVQSPPRRASRSAIVASTRRRTSSWWRIASAPAAWARALTLKGWRTASTAARNFGEPIA